MSCQNKVIKWDHSDSLYYMQVDQGLCCLRDRLGPVSNVAHYLFSVPTDKEGIDLTILETHLKQNRPPTMEGLKSPFWAYVYTIPTFNNPMGHCMNPGRYRIIFNTLTHCSRVTRKKVIGKQCSPRSDAAERGV